MKVGDLVSKNIKFTNQTLYGVIINMEADIKDQTHVKVHWFGDYGTFWTNTQNIKAIT